MLSDPSIYSQALHKLVEGSYLKPSTKLSHESPLDKRIKYEGEEKAKISGFPTAKQLREAREIAEARLRREEEEAEKIGMVSTILLLACIGELCPCRNAKLRIRESTNLPKYALLLHS